jgi:hypothetical protein
MHVSFSDDIKALAPALAAAQASMGSAQLDSKNGHFRSRYASLASCLHAALPALAEHKLSLLQHPGFDPSTQIVSVTTCVLHASGQWMKSTCSLPLGGKKDGHALKSATTYLRRIGIVSILGLPEEDDDGNATSAVSVRRAPKKEPKVSKGDLDTYQKQLKAAGLDPKLVAAFLRDHGRAPASDLTGAQLFQRLEWAQANTAAIKQWGEQR